MPRGCRSADCPAVGDLADDGDESGASDRPPQCRWTPVETWFVTFKPTVPALLALTPDMPATVLAERVG